MNLESSQKQNYKPNPEESKVSAVFEVLILGCNSASFAYGRHHTAQLLRIGTCQILIDCGEGTQLLLQQHKISFFRISHIFIGHLHGDHYLGLMGLLFSMNLQGRKQSLSIFGPPGLSEILVLQLKYSHTVLSFLIDFVETNTENHYLLYENAVFRVVTLPLEHRIACCGFLFEEQPGALRLLANLLPDGLQPQQLRALKQGKDVYDGQNNLICECKQVSLPPLPPRKYAYCSDTKYSDSLIEWVKQADLLYHESTFDESLVERAAQTFHSTAKQAAQIALQAQVGQLLLGHYSSRYRDPTILLEQALEVFDSTLLSQEGQVYKIKHKSVALEL